MTSYFFKVHENYFTVGGFAYYVMVYRSVDGVNFLSCGIGEYCKTKEDCEKYMNDYRASHTDEKEIA